MSAGGDRTVVSGVRSCAAGQAIAQVVQFAVSVALARILAREDFGLLAMAHVFLAFLLIFEDLGTGSAIVRRRTLSPRLLSSLFTVNVATGALFAGGMALAAPVFGAIYGTDRVVPIVRALGLTFLFSSFGRAQHALLRREMRFAALVRIEVGVAVARGILAIVLAVGGHGVWSLVIAALAGHALQAALLWAVSGTVLRPAFALREIRRVAGYSLSVVGYKLSGYFTRNANHFLVGRALGAGSLGVYDMAWRLYFYPVASVTDVLDRVMFPALSRAREGGERLRELFLRSLGGIALLVFPMMTGLFVLASPFVDGVLGPEWGGVTPLLLLLAPAGALQAIAAPAGSIWQATGRSRRLVFAGAASAGGVVLSFFAGIPFGLTGVAAAYAIVAVPLAALSLGLSLPLVRLGPGALLRALAPAAAASALMGTTVFLARRALQSAGHGPLTVLGVGVPLGIAVYAAAVFLLRPPALADFLRLTGLRGRLVTAEA